jgi:hypothetical protein
MAILVTLSMTSTLCIPCYYLFIMLKIFTFQIELEEGGNKVTKGRENPVLS